MLTNYYRAVAGHGPLPVPPYQVPGMVGNVDKLDRYILALAQEKAWRANWAPVHQVSSSSSKMMGRVSGLARRMLFESSQTLRTSLSAPEIIPIVSFLSARIDVSRANFSAGCFAGVSQQQPQRGVQVGDAHDDGGLKEDFDEEGSFKRKVFFGEGD